MVANQSSRLGELKGSTTTSRRGREGPASALGESKSISFICRESSFDSPRNPFHSVLRALAIGALCCVSACSSKPIAVPPNLIVSSKAPQALPAAPVATPNAPPQIVRIWFSTLTLRPGTWFDGTIVGSSNVASVEVRTAAFSIDSTQVAPGIYHFHMRVLELPPLSRRHLYELYIIARNTPGDEAVEEAPLRVE
jgi:hypothetical protein